MQPAPSFGRRGLKTPTTAPGAYTPSFAPQSYAPAPKSAPTRESLDIGWLLFSTEGRIARSKYWACKIGLLIFIRILGAAGTVSNSTLKAAQTAHSVTPTLLAGTLLVLLLVLVGFGAGVWAGIAVTIKRWHDRDRSWTWVMLGFVPILGWLWQGIECAFLEGTLGPNRFGPSPKGISGVSYQASLDEVFS